MLLREDDGYKIRDLDSRNGTFINGSVISERKLSQGDQIAVGQSVFVLLVNEHTDQAAREAVEFDDSFTQATEQIRPQDVLYLQPERILRELPVTSRLGRNLNALLKISQVVHSISNLEQLQARILELIFEVVPAKRAAILLDTKGSEKFSSQFAHPSPAKRGETVRVSHTITRQVMEQGVAILGRRRAR
jgi:FHA domain